MTAKIPLRLTGIRLTKPDDYACIPEVLQRGMFWESDCGVSLVTVFARPGAAVSTAASLAARIPDLMPGVRAAEVHVELVSTGGISHRAGLVPETVRLWAGHMPPRPEPFPAPWHEGLYAWHEVLTWIRATLHIDPEPGIEYLTSLQRAELNLRLA